MKKLIAVLVVLGLLVTLLPGCGSTNEATPPASAAQTTGVQTQQTTTQVSTANTGEKKVINFWHHWKEYINPMIADFQAKHPDIEIKATYYGDPAITDALNVAAASGTGPDCYFIWGGMTQYVYVKKGFALDLAPYREKYQWDKKLAKSALDLCTFDGKLFGIPVLYTGVGLIVRKDMLDKYAGGKVPATYDEYLSFNDKLAKDGISSIATAGKDGWHVMRVMDALLEHFCGPELHDNIMNMKASWNCPEVVNAYADFKKWYDKGYLNKDLQALAPHDCKVLFYNGKSSSQFEAANVETNLKTDGMTDIAVDFFMFPSDKQPARMTGWITQNAVAANSKVKDEAVMFVDFLASFGE